MVRSKNLAKRNEIVKSAYRLFGMKGYENVIIREIAEDAGISKALVQHYFGKKSEILELMLREMLEQSFQYIDELLGTRVTIYHRLSVYANLFFSAGEKQPHLNKLIKSICSDRDLLESWILIVHEWLHRLKLEEMNVISEKKLHTALAFAMAGGTQILLYPKEWESSVQEISELMVSSFMRNLNRETREIGDVLEQTQLLLRQMDVGEFHQFLVNTLFWYA